MRPSVACRRVRVRGAVAVLHVGGLSKNDSLKKLATRNRHNFDPSRSTRTPRRAHGGLLVRVVAAAAAPAPVATAAATITTASVTIAASAIAVAAATPSKAAKRATSKPSVPAQPTLVHVTGTTHSACTPPEAPGFSITCHYRYDES